MHLAIYHEPVHADGPGFDTYGPYARYVLEFARHFEQVTVFAPSTDQPTYFSGHPLEAPNVTVVPLPFFMTHAQALRGLPAIVGSFRRHAADLDVINARGTAPFAYILWLMTRRRGVPFIYHFASDPFEVIASSGKYRGLYRLFARLAYRIEFGIQEYIMRRNYSFASGSKLCRRLRRSTPNVEEIIESTLLEDDYYLRDDCCRGGAVRLLYVGRLEPGKGLSDILTALGILRRDGLNVELDIVGEGPLKTVLRDKAAELGILERVHLHGAATMGPQLNAYYDNADIFTLPSLSEGSPRVVIEALGHSLPVVATSVGNVPELLGGGSRGVLIPKEDPEALAAGIATIVKDKALRRRCIREGYQFARQYSVNSCVARIAAKARELVGARRRGGSACGSGW